MVKTNFHNESENTLSDRYFRDALEWYNLKFIFPIVHRTILLIASIFLFICLFVIILQIRSQLPITTNMKYLLNIDHDAFSNQVTINTDDSPHSNPLYFIARILAEDYVIKRESYDYEKLKDQIIYVKQTSTKSLFKSFYESLSTQNTSSPLIKYQKYGKRRVKINNFEIIDNNNIIIDFSAEARDMDNKIFDFSKNKVKLSFEIDPLQPNMQNGTNYKFLVTGYRVLSRE